MEIKEKIENLTLEVAEGMQIKFLNQSDVILNDLTFKANGDILRKGRKIINDLTLVNALRKELNLEPISQTQITKILPYTEEVDSEGDTIYKARFKSADNKKVYNPQMCFNALADDPKSEPIYEKCKCECTAFEVNRAEDKYYLCKHQNELKGLIEI
jgi:hypothetical protein